MAVFEPRFRITNAITAALTRIERARGFLEAATLSENWIQAMGKRALILEAHHTTHIEGTRLRLDQSEKLLEGAELADVDPDDARELLNYRDAFHFVSDYVSSGSPVTEGLIREIHKRLVQGVRGGKADPGRYRTLQNYVANATTNEVIYTPPPAYEVPILMAELIAWLQASSPIHPVLVSGLAQFQLVHIHPFLDGNGRTSRLLSTLLLYRAGYDFKKLFTLSEYYDRDRARFYRALQEVREAGMDMTGWLEFFVEGLATQLVEVTEKGKGAIRLDLLAQQHALSARQIEILRLFAERETTPIRNLEAALAGVHRRTLQRDLQKLEDLGLVERQGSARQSAYRLKWEVK